MIIQLLQKKNLVEIEKRTLNFIGLLYFAIRTISKYVKIQSSVDAK